METNILLETGTNELEIVEFILKNKDRSDNIISQSFGLNVAKVKEIIRMPVLTKMPNQHNTIYGVFNLRDKIIPALDLSKYLFGLENSDEGRKMIIAEFNKMQCGFIVSDVQRIHRVSWTKIETPEMLEEFDREHSCIIGIIRLESKNILMLDIEKIIADISPLNAIDTGSLDKPIDWKPVAVTAEDSITVRRMITDRLKTAGFDIKSFNDGEEAWEFMAEISAKVAKGEELSRLVNIVITDIEMPKMDGYTLTKKIKSDNNLSGLPVVIFSSIINKEALHRGKSVGADAQMSKPQIGELLEVVRLLLEKQKSSE
jgi:two-component system, chemotaxis family, chemotaxis protein CheV